MLKYNIISGCEHENSVTIPTQVIYNGPTKIKTVAIKSIYPHKVAWNHARLSSAQIVCFPPPVSTLGPHCELVPLFEGQITSFLKQNL